MNFFSLGKTEVTWSQDKAPDHMSAQALAAIQNAKMSPTVFTIRIHIAWQIAGWKTKNFYNGIKALEKCWTRCILVAGYYVK